MSGTVDLYDVKVVDGYVLRCDIVRDLNKRLKYIFDVYDIYFSSLLFTDDVDELCDYFHFCDDFLRIVNYLRSISLISYKSLEYEVERVQVILTETISHLERRED